MPKIDKSKYTKEQIQKMLAERRKQKALEQLAVKESIKVDDFTFKEYGFVLGNGTSRKGLYLDTLRKYGKIYGCNAIYREYDPDYLVCVDAKMVFEIDKRKYQYQNPNVWTNYNKAYRNIEKLNYFKPSKGWSSGPTALWLASQHSYEKIYILGFDYKGLNDGKLVNNLYAGTPNYKSIDAPSTYYGNWLRQTKNILQQHRHIQYIRVITSDNFIPPELNNFENFTTIYMEEFQKTFGISRIC